MSEQNTTVATTNSTNGTEPKDTGKLYTSQQECEANEPKAAKEANAKKANTWKVFSVKRPEALGGETVWLWSVGHVNAKATVATHDGYEASSAGRVREAKVTQDGVASFLAAMSEEDRAALIKQYLPGAARGTEAKPKGKGK